MKKQRSRTTSRSIARKGAKAAHFDAQLRRFSRTQFPKPDDPSQGAWFRERAKVERALIGQALANAPSLDFEQAALERFPFNEVASSRQMEHTIEKIVRQRTAGNPWNTVHGPMSKTDQSCDGYLAWIDALRDVAFAAGVQYAHASLPSWWDDYRALDERRQALAGKLVGSFADSAEGGSR